MGNNPAHVKRSSGVRGNSHRQDVAGRTGRRTASQGAPTRQSVGTRLGIEALWRVQAVSLIVSILASALIATTSLLLGAHAQRLQVVRAARQDCQTALLGVVQALNDEAQALDAKPGFYPGDSIRQLVFEANRVKIFCYTIDVFDALADKDVEIATFEVEVDAARKLAWQFTSSDTCSGTKSNMGACMCLRMEDHVVDLALLTRNLADPTFWSTVKAVRHSLRG